MTFQVLNQFSFIGSKKLITQIMNKLNSKDDNHFIKGCITNLIPIPKDISVKSELNFSEKLKIYTKYKVSSITEWVNTCWGMNEFGGIIDYSSEDNKLNLSFYTEYSDSKIILLNIQKKYPKLKIAGSFQTQDVLFSEQFETKWVDGNIFYKVNEGEFIHYTNPIQLRIDELLINSDNMEYSNVA